MKVRTAGRGCDPDAFQRPAVAPIAPRQEGKNRQGRERIDLIGNSFGPIQSRAALQLLAQERPEAARFVQCADRLEIVLQSSHQLHRRSQLTPEPRERWQQLPALERCPVPERTRLLGQHEQVVSRIEDSPIAAEEAGRLGHDLAVQSDHDPVGIGADVLP